MTEQEILERVSAARTYLTAKIPFLGFLSLKMKPRITTAEDGCQTAEIGPDGTLVLNEEFVSKLSEPEMRGLLCHEVLHPALEFFSRLGTRDMRVFNCAHDFAINLIIHEFVAGKLEDSIKLPPGGLLDTKYSGMSAEEIYASFPKLSKKQMQELLNNLLSGDCRPGQSSGKDGKAAGEGDEGAMDRMKRDWQIAIVAAAQVHEQHKGRGSLPAGLRILIDEMLSPKIHWSIILSRWLGENAGSPDLTYQRPSRRNESVGEILIGRRRKSFPDVTILWDTSGSMHGEEKKIFPEVAAMCADLDLTLRVIIIDAAIHADLTDVKAAEEVAAALAGGGGSDFRPAFERLDEERNDSVVIAFTDGAIGVPEVQPESLKGVVWVLTCNGGNPTGGKWGHVLRLDKEENGSWE
jgi:predicted metal-dependent peptidase